MDKWDVILDGTNEEASRRLAELIKELEQKSNRPQQ
jgi:hypothetical protein